MPNISRTPPKAGRAPIPATSQAYSTEFATTSDSEVDSRDEMPPPPPPAAKGARRKKTSPADDYLKMITELEFPDFDQSDLEDHFIELYATIKKIAEAFRTEQSKSVTRDMKTGGLREIGRALNLVEKIYLAEVDAKDPGRKKEYRETSTQTAHMETETTTTPEDLPAVIERAVAKAVRTELGRAAAEARPPLSYAQAAAAGVSPTPAAQRPKETPAPTQIKPAPPAMIVTCAKEGAPRQMIENLKKTINFRETKYTPSRVVHLSNKKLRVEFDKKEHREDAIAKINAASPTIGVTAEPEKKLRPMVILKGVSKEVRREELAQHIREQNEELGDLREEDLTLRFIRNNRSPHLYNAVFIASAPAWRAILRLGRVRLDYQRIHAEDFCPFIQCRRCHQFGHTQARCEAARLCAHCGQSGHEDQSCPKSEEPPSCTNCANFNTKYKAERDIKHSALSSSCPRHRAMLSRVLEKVDYGDR